MHDQLAFLAAFFLLVFVYSVFLVLEGMQGRRQRPPGERHARDSADTTETPAADMPSPTSETRS